MRIAVPMKGQVLDQHFGHCEQFALIGVVPETRQVSASQVVPAPVHAHGALPRAYSARRYTPCKGLDSREWTPSGEDRSLPAEHQRQGTSPRMGYISIRQIACPSQVLKGKQPGTSNVRNM